MGKTLTVKDLQRIARKLLSEGGIARKEVKLSEKPDYVDRTLLRAEKLLAKL